MACKARVSYAVSRIERIEGGEWACEERQYAVQKEPKRCESWWMEAC